MSSKPAAAAAAAAAVGVPRDVAAEMSACAGVLVKEIDAFLATYSAFNDFKSETLFSLRYAATKLSWFCTDRIPKNAKSEKEELVWFCLHGPQPHYAAPEGPVPAKIAELKSTAETIAVVAKTWTVSPEILAICTRVFAGKEISNREQIKFSEEIDKWYDFVGDLAAKVHGCKKRNETFRVLKGFSAGRNGLEVVVWDESLIVPVARLVPSEIWKLAGAKPDASEKELLALKHKIRVVVEHTTACGW
jgi:hypothetical protein